MTPKKRVLKASEGAQQAKSVITRRQVRDGLIVGEEVSINLETGDVSKELDAFRQLFPAVPELVKAYAEKAQRAIDGGATGTRLKYANDALWQSGQVIRYLQKGDAPSAVQHSLWMMQCLWRMDFKQVEPEVFTGVRAQRQRINAGIGSGQERTAERKAEWDKWQLEADRVRAENPALTKSRVCEIVGATFKVTRQAVAKRVTIVATERRRFK